eukprot:jgi/Bigna1/144245/aug1.85_g18953
MVQNEDIERKDAHRRHSNFAAPLNTRGRFLNRKLDPIDVVVDDDTDDDEETGLIDSSLLSTLLSEDFRRHMSDNVNLAALGGNEDFSANVNSWSASYNKMPVHLALFVGFLIVYFSGQRILTTACEVLHSYQDMMKSTSDVATLRENYHNELSHYEIS